MDTNNIPTVEVTVTHHVMTDEEIKKEKIDNRKRKKERRNNEKLKRAEARKLKSNFMTMNCCMIHPDNIKIGCLTECVYTKEIIDFEFMGSMLGHREEKLEPIKGLKTLIQISPDFELYMDLDEINSWIDLANIRQMITKDGIIISGKVLSCNHGRIRVDRKTLQGHPYFEKSTDKEPISIKQLKKVLEN